MNLRPLLAGAVALTLLSNASAQHPRCEYIYVFGDSLSDNGNLFRLTGASYWMGRFSNGQVCVEQLARTFRATPNKLRDYALGGATTTDVLERQVQAALAAVSGRLPGKTPCYITATPTAFPTRLAVFRPTFDEFRNRRRLPGSNTG